MDRLRRTTVFDDPRFTVIVVQSVEFQTGGSNRKRFLTGSLKPIALIVKEPGRSYALDMNARSVDIESFGAGTL